MRKSLFFLDWRHLAVMQAFLDKWHEIKAIRQAQIIIKKKLGQGQYL